MNKVEFNKKFPIGTSVRYFAIKGIGDGKVTKIKSECWALGHGDLVVKVTCKSGGVSIDHIEIA